MTPLFSFPTRLLRANDVTDRQAAVLLIYAMAREQNRRPPTYKQIAAILEVTHHNSVTEKVRALELKGLLSHIPRKPLATSPTAKGEAVVAALRADPDTIARFDWEDLS